MSADSTVGIVFGLVGPLLLAIGLFIWIRTRMFVAQAQPVQGTVVRMNYSYSSRGGGGYAPVFQFRTLSGETIEVAEKLYTNPPQFQAGQTVEILYDPEKPKRARINKWFRLYFVPLLLAGLGLIFSGVGVALLISNLPEILARFF